MLSSGALDRRAGCADTAHARRPLDRAGRPGVPAARGDDGAAARARETEDHDGRHPVPRAPAAAPARPAGRGTGGRLPDLQRGLRRARRPGGGGDQARTVARRPDARRSRGRRAAGADAAAGRTPFCARPRRRARPAGRSGPLAVGPGRDRGRARRARPGARARRARPVRAAGGDRVAALGGRARPRRDRGALRRARPCHRLTRRAAQPGGGDRRGGRSGGRARAARDPRPGRLPLPACGAG